MRTNSVLRNPEIDPGRKQAPNNSVRCGTMCALLLGAGHSIMK